MVVQVSIEWTRVRKVSSVLLRYALQLEVACDGGMSLLNKHVSS